MSAVYSTVLTYFDLHGRGTRLARSELMLYYGLSRIGLTMEEWEEFRRICRDAGVSASDELDTFRRMVQLLDRHGDDGYGDRPADMPRITYWFQHVPERFTTPRSRYNIGQIVELDATGFGPGALLQTGDLGTVISTGHVNEFGATMYRLLWHRDGRENDMVEDRLRISTPAPVTRDRSRSPRSRQ